MRRRVLDWIIALIASAVCILVVTYWREQWWLAMIAGFFAVLFFVLGVLDDGRRRLTTSTNRGKESVGRLKQVVLLSEEEQELTSWHLYGRTSLVIGRDEGENQVDINLGNVTYAGFIDIEHAVLNYANGHWYIEDLHSENGVKVKKYDDTRQYKLATDKPCRLGPGDIIYIAQTKLQVR